MSRIKERIAAGRSASDAVVTGAGQSGRVVTAAPLIMAVVFAFVVRLTLVPAAMSLIGTKIWYRARWYDRYVPDPDIEGERLEHHLAESRSEAAPCQTPSEDGRWVRELNDRVRR